MNRPSGRRQALAAVLLRKAFAQQLLPTQLDKVEDRDRGFTHDLAFGTARWQPRLSALAAKLLQKPFRLPMPMLRRCCWSASISCSPPGSRPMPRSARR